MFSLELPHQGDFNENTQYIIFNMKKKITPNYPKSAAMRIFSKGLKNEFETAVVNEPTEFESLKVYCILFFSKLTVNVPEMKNSQTCKQCGLTLFAVYF